MKDLPLSVEQLVEDLDKMIPERCPNEEDSERAIWIYSGKRSIVRYLKVLLDEERKPRHVRT